MKISLNSSLFHVTPPCCYHVFQDFLYSLEAEEMEYSKERAEELIDSPDRQIPLIEGGIDKIRRCDLPRDNPEYACAEEVTLNWDKAREIIAKCWLRTFEQWIADRYLDVKRKNKIKLHFKDVWSPREYNFSSDECGFYLSIPKAEMNRIIGSCFDDREGFRKYLKDFHSDRDGYWSYVSNNIDRHMEAWSLFRSGMPLEDNKALEHLIWVCLDYWLFGMEAITYKDGDEEIFDANQKEFENNLWCNVSDLQGNGAFYEIMEYTPIERSEVAR